METELLHQDIHKMLSQIEVGSLMSLDVLTVYEGWSVRKLSQFFLKHNISGAPVIAADDELVGVVSQSDVVRFDTRKPDEKEVAKIVEYYCGFVNRPLEDDEVSRIQDKAIDYMTVHSIMTSEVISVESSDNLAQAYQVMRERDVHRVMVTNNGILVGVVTAKDILNYLCA